jgi:Ca2+-binding EF-hand superfamily protein
VPPGRTVQGSCSETLSRDLFTACDADGDDRLDVFEAATSLDGMQNPTDSAGFARLDTDRDGFVSWPEFDHSLRAALRKTGSCTVRPVRRLQSTATSTKRASALQQFLQLHDANGNGSLDPGEVDRYLKGAGLPPTLGTQLKGRDLDHSGELDEAELAPWFEQLPNPAPPAERGPGKARLPAPWHTVDQDQNLQLDAVEFTAALRRLDPQLERWAEPLWRALDADRDGVLQASELTLAPTPAATGKAPAPGPLPKQSPLR